MAPTPPKWLEPLPKAGDILLCYFPYVEDHGKPSLDIHPVLVLAIGRGPKGLGLLVAYGSSRGLHMAGPTNLIVDPEEFQGTGLRYPTRFDLERHRWLPYNSQYFSEARDGRPNLGSLPTELSDALNEARHQVELRSGQSLIPNRPTIAQQRGAEPLDESAQDE